MEKYKSALIKHLELLDLEAVRAVEKKLIEAYRDCKSVYIVGNGGSAATASHFACDLLKIIEDHSKPRFKAHSLVDNNSVITALGNDIGYENIFWDQINAHLNPHDLLIAFSASGNSPNILKAVEAAKENGGFVIGFTGFSGGKLREKADLSIHIPCDNYGIVEDIHLSLEHMISQSLKKTFKEIE